VKAVLEVRCLKKYFATSKKGVYVKAVDGIDFEVYKGDVFALVGESGSGKSTTAYTVMGMYEPTAGKIFYRGQDISKIHWKRPMELKKEIQIVFQDPGTSLNPSKTVAQIVGAPIVLHKKPRGEKLKEAVVHFLNMVQLPSEYLYKLPRDIGGGEKQLIAIARALASGPSFVVLDEPTSALDVSIQAKIIRTLLRLKEELELTYLFITHDLSLVRNISNRIAIMYLGKIVEQGPTVDIFAQPAHPYTQMLLSSIPVVTKAEEALKPKKVTSTGEIPSPVNVPPGCSFHTRCPFAWDLCKQVEPVNYQISTGRWVKCHLYSNKEVLVKKETEHER
jgi:peptide/nickel transport system ATP-binding protein